jgi:dCTP diphosphatase
MWVSPGSVAPVRDDGLEDVLQRLRRFTGERHWSRFHDPKNLAMLVASEAGELVHLFRWVKNDEADAFAARPEHRGAIEEEIADVAIGVLLLADRVGVDLLEIVRSKIARNAQKYPVARDGDAAPASGPELRLVPR